MPPTRNQNRRGKNKKQVVEEGMGEGFFHQDIMICILSWMPVKSLVRFKSVCKAWLKLLSNWEFVKIHYEHYCQGPKTYSVKSHVLSGLLTEKKFQMIRGDTGKVFLDSCRGLICMERPLFNREIVLWNPATNLLKYLPPSKADFGAVESVSLGFGCNAGDEEGVYDYKVVRISGLKGEKMRSAAEVYSSKSDSWKTIQVGFEFMVKDPSTNPVIAKGMPYWVAVIDDKTRAAEDCKVLLGFDPVAKGFKIVPMPKLEWKCTFVEWKESLAAIVCLKKDDEWVKSIDVWVYGDGDSEWTMNARFEEGLKKLQVERCINCTRSGKIVGRCMNGKFFVYDPEKSDVVVVNMGEKGWMWEFQMFPYEESLAFLEGMTPYRMWKNTQKQDVIPFFDGLFTAAFHVFNRSVGQVHCMYPLGC